MSARKRFSRPLGTRRYARRFVLATEGEQTEPRYFQALGLQCSGASVFCVQRPRGSSPEHVLRRMQEHLSAEEMRAGDEAWLVVDKDHWTDEQLGRLHAWAAQAPNRHLALSNPNFEYWLLLHFEDGLGIGSTAECGARLQRHVPDYRKRIDPRKFSLERIEDAVTRARRRDDPPCADWPRRIGSTTVYRLVESILLVQAGRGGQAD